MGWYKENDMSEELKEVFYRKMSFEEYLDFLDEYWEIFEPIPEPRPIKEYKLVLLLTHSCLVDLPIKNYSLTYNFL